MTMQRLIGRWGHALVLIAIYTFLLAPIVLVVIAALNSGNYLRFPPEGFSLRWFEEFFRSARFQRSLIFSLKLAAVATVLSTVLGTMTALYTVRNRGVLRQTVETLIMAPLLVPGVLTGVALLLFIQLLGATDQNFLALVAGHTVLCLPFVYLLTVASLLRLDPRIEEAARSLGAGPIRTFLRVTLPLIKNGVVSGGVFAFILSFDEFNVSLLLAGTRTTPLPIEIFNELHFNFSPTIAAAGVISIVLAAIGLVIMQSLVGLDSVYADRSADGRNAK